MKRSTEIYKAIGNLELSSLAQVCRACHGKGRWIFFKTTGACQKCFGIGILGNMEVVKQINEYIDSGSLHIEEMLKHSNKVP